MAVRKVFSIIFLAFVTSSLQAQQCCQCRASDGHPFQVRQATGCSIACQANGGEYSGMAKCYGTGLPPGSYPAPVPDACASYVKVVGGNCKGNNWCRCEVRVRVITQSPVVGQKAQVEFFNDNLGSVAGGDGFFRHKLWISGQVDWGDQTPKQGGLDSGLVVFEHAYSKPGTYTITPELIGDFKWQNAYENASCSYECRSRPTSATIIVESQK